MSDGTRPLVLGYIREDDLAGERLVSARTRLEAFAHAEGFTLGTVFVEGHHKDPWAFDALMEQVRRGDEAWAVVVPHVGHLGRGRARALRARRDGHTTVTVLVAP
jgi:hypothetical protein